VRHNFSGGADITVFWSMFPAAQTKNDLAWLTVRPIASNTIAQSCIQTRIRGFESSKIPGKKEAES